MYFGLVLGLDRRPANGLTVAQPNTRLPCSRAQVVVPNMACGVIDRAIQVHGGMGVCQDTFLAKAYAHMRTLRIADGPDEVHVRSVAKYEYRRGADLVSRL